MSKKLTLEFCKNESLKRGFLILDTEYLSNKIKMNFVHVSCGFIFSTNWDNFYNKESGCPICSNKDAGIRKRWKIEDIEIISKKRGYQLLSKEYFGTNFYLEFLCLKCKDIFVMSWRDFYNTKHNCPKCSHKERGIKLRLELNFCKTEALKLGYLLKEDAYISAIEKMNFIHLKCGTSFFMRWNSFYTAKQRCPKCSEKLKESYLATEIKEYCVKRYFAKTEYRIFKNPYTNNFLPYDIYFDIKNMKIFIEIQGNQHYKFDKYYHRTIKDFEYSRKKDRMKKKYARQNGIYIEIDLRKVKTLEQAINKINEVIDSL